MKYKIINTDLMLNGLLHREGDTLDLTADEAKPIAGFLEKIPAKAKSASTVNAEKKEKINHEN